MTHDRILRTASAIALTLALTACGGGGESEIASMPPPPATPTPAAALSNVPARATVGAGPAPVFATVAGPNFTTGPAVGTVFPMLQVAMVQYTRYKPDSVTNAAGGRATFAGGQVSVSIPDSRPNPWSGYADLDWTRAGQWSVWTDWNDVSNARGAFIIGFETPGEGVPATGSATFSGRAEGTVFNSSVDRAAIELTGGTALFTADFSARTLNGTVTGLAARDTVNGLSTGVFVPWDDFSFTSTITANAFSGTTLVTSVPGGITSLAGGATGTIEGRFFGPAAQEAGAVWGLFDATSGEIAVGTLTGKQH